MGEEEFAELTYLLSMVSEQVSESKTAKLIVRKRKLDYTLLMPVDRDRDGVLVGVSVS